MTMKAAPRVWIVRAAWLLALCMLGWLAWQRFQPSGNEDGITGGNGRVEAVEIDVATRVAGRVREIKVAEGEFVTAGQVVAMIDSDVLEAQLRQAEAQVQQARSAVATAMSQLAQRQSEKASAQAGVAQRDVDVDSASTKLKRSEALAAKGFFSAQALDNDRLQLQGAQAARRAALSQVAATEAAIASAQSQVAGAQSSEKAAQANVERIQVDIADMTLKAPRDGRVQYRVVQSGEIVAAGGRVLNLLDLSDVYMTFFLPTAAAGRIAIGAEARLVLDAAPQYVIPARISFVASEAQFTPRTVETASEREKLMFRVRAQIPPDLLRKHITRVKTGLPGMAYVRLDEKAAWPARLQVKLPQ
jgi:HlyD family secretion protein